MGMRARQRNEREQKQAWKRARNSTGHETGQRVNEIKTGMKYCRRAKYEKCQKGAGPETGQRDERNRNGHEILPRSRMRRMSKKLEHQLLLGIKQTEGRQENIP